MSYQVLILLIFLRKRFIYPLLNKCFKDSSTYYFSVERLKTELNIERMISENQKKSKDSTEQHLLSVVNTLNKDRLSAHTSQGEIMTLKDQIQTLRLELVSSNEEVKSLRLVYAKFHIHIPTIDDLKIYLWLNLIFITYSERVTCLWTH